MLNKTPPNNLHSFLVRNHVICFLPTLSYNLSQFVCFTKTSDRNTKHRRLAHFGLQNHSNYSWRAAPWPDLTHIPQGSDRYVLRQGLPRTNPIAPIWPEHIWKWDVETPINPTRSGWGCLWGQNSTFGILKKENLGFCFLRCHSPQAKKIGSKAFWNQEMQERYSLLVKAVFGVSSKVRWKKTWQKGIRSISRLPEASTSEELVNSNRKKNSLFPIDEKLDFQNFKKN